MEQNSTNIVLNQEVDEYKYPISLYQNLTSTQATAKEVSWEQLCRSLSIPIISEDKDVFLYGPYRLSTPKRSNQNVVEISYFVFDIDYPQGRTAQDIVNLVVDYDAIVHSTWSHTRENPRYRLIVRLSRPVPVKRFADVRGGFLSLNPVLASIIDKACSDPSRGYYMFSYPSANSNYAEFVENKGLPLDPATCLIPLQANQTTSATNSSATLNTIAPSSVQVGGRNTALTSYVGSIINKGLSFSDTLTLALTWNQSLPQPLEVNEVTRTHSSIWKKHHLNNPAYQVSTLAAVSSMNNYRLISAGSLLASPPQPRSWIIKDFLPSKIVAALIAAGGTGKSYLAMHIAVSVASGSSLFGKFIPTKPAKVVFISGEDDETELKRRLHAVTQGIPTALKNTIISNLHFIDFADAFELFTQKPASGEVQITNVPLRLVATIKQLAGEAVDFIILDPVSRFRGGEENSASDTTRFVQSLQYLRDHLGASVLALHHVNKGARVNGTSQNNARGSSAFIDGVRLVYELNALSDAEIEKAYGKQVIMPRVLTLSCVKSNYGKPIEPLTLCKRTDGTLEVFGVQAGQHQDLSILQEIKLNPISKTQFKKAYGAATGKFGLSEKSLVRKLEDLEKQGLLNIPTRGVMHLTPNGNTLVGP
jgi:hypothetical protein